MSLPGEGGGATSMIFTQNREGAKNSGGKTAGPVPVRCIQVYRRSPSQLAPLCLTIQVPDQRIFTGHQQVCAPTQNQEPIHLACTCVTCGWL